MSRLLCSLAALGLLLTAFVANAAPVSAGDPCFHDLGRPPVSDGTASVVKLGDCAFYPTIARVPVGSEFRFLNADIVGHEIVGANLTWGKHDKILVPGDEVSVSFTAPGVFPFTCMLHPGMSGAIIVGEVSGAAGLGAAGVGAAVDVAAPDTGSAGADGTPATEPGPGGSASSSGVGPVVIGLATVGLLVAFALTSSVRRCRSAPTDSIA